MLVAYTTSSRSSRRGSINTTLGTPCFTLLVPMMFYSTCLFCCCFFPRGIEGWMMMPTPLLPSSSAVSSVVSSSSAPSSSFPRSSRTRRRRRRSRPTVALSHREDGATLLRETDRNSSTSASTGANQQEITIVQLATFLASQLLAQRAVVDALAMMQALAFTDTTEDANSNKQEITIL